MLKYAVLGCAAALSGFLPAKPAVAEENRINGYYAGIFVGAVILDSSVSFPATAARPAADYVDQGGDGLLLAVRAGWGTVFGRHGYAGVEGEIAFPYNVTSTLNSMGVTYKARLRNEFGVFGRLGYTPDRRSLIFMRAGLTIPRQTFQSVDPGRSQDAEWSVVPAVGIGTEVHVTRASAIRFDATYSFANGRNDIETYAITGGVIWRF